METIVPFYAVNGKYICHYTVNQSDFAVASLSLYSLLTVATHPRLWNQERLHCSQPAAPLQHGRSDDDRLPTPRRRFRGRRPGLLPRTLLSSASFVRSKRNRFIFVSMRTARTHKIGSAGFLMTFTISNESIPRWVIKRQPSSKR